MWAVKKPVNQNLIIIYKYCIRITYFHNRYKFILTMKTYSFYNYLEFKIY